MKHVSGNPALEKFLGKLSYHLFRTTCFIAKGVTFNGDADSAAYGDEGSEGSVKVCS